MLNVPPETEAERSIDATRERILAEGVILCIRFQDDERVVEACRAAARGGLRVLELTLTTPGALEAMAELAADPDLCVGAGTVLTPHDVAAVAAAGGCFALSPVHDPAVLDAARSRGLLAIPGAATPTEILGARRAGASLVKVFPAEALGGPAFLRRLRGPFPDVPLIPTSGPTADSIGEYVAAGALAVGVGPEVVRDGFDAQQVEREAQRVRCAMDAARGREA